MDIQATPYGRLRAPVRSLLDQSSSNVRLLTRVTVKWREIYMHVEKMKSVQCQVLRSSICSGSGIRASSSFFFDFIFFDEKNIKMEQMLSIVK